MCIFLFSHFWSMIFFSFFGVYNCWKFRLTVWFLGISIFSNFNSHTSLFLLLVFDFLICLILDFKIFYHFKWLIPDFWIFLYFVVANGLVVEWPRDKSNLICLFTRFSNFWNFILWFFWLLEFLIWKIFQCSITYSFINFWFFDFRFFDY